MKQIPKLICLLSCLSLTLPLLGYSTALAQDETSTDDARVAWLKEQAIPIRTIEPAGLDTVEDFSDLMPLIDYIGDAQIVALGEQTHGDGAAFHTKTRLIKFLHQHMDFNVLVWESGLFDCRQVDEAFRNGESIEAAANRGIFPIWSRSAQVRPLLEYVASTHATDRPLETAGMDSQITSQHTASALRAHVNDLYERAGTRAELAETMQQINTLLQGFENPPYRQGDDVHKSNQVALEEFAAALLDDDGPFQSVETQRECAFTARALRNVAAFTKMMYWFMKPADVSEREKNQLRGALAREPAMADTLIWLAREYYHDRRLIVWCASSHIMHNSRTVEMQQDDGTWAGDTDPWEPMGNRVHEALGDKLYTVGFLAHSGQIGSIFRNPSSLAPPTAGSLDDLCHQTGLENLFIDLRTLSQTEGGAWLREPLVARPRGYQPMRADWTRVCDAFVFNNTMYPSTMYQPPPEEVEPSNDGDQ